MEIELGTAYHGSCPYLGDRTWISEEFVARSFPPALYESLLVQGFRRGGAVFYRNSCPSCSSCIPIRLDAQAWVPGKSRRRLARRNAAIRVELLPSGFSEERFQLYGRYRQARHAGPGEAAEGRASYESFLVRNPLGTGAITEYRLADGKLVATGYLDILPGGLSSVYFAFDPDYASLSLGTWSVGREVELTASLGKRWYYLGFWVPGSPKMDYKGDFGPFEYAREGSWTPVAGRGEVEAAAQPCPDGQPPC
jgi:arginine-tRNA-protein transferase